MKKGTELIINPQNMIDEENVHMYYESLLGHFHLYLKDWPQYTLIKS